VAEPLAGEVCPEIESAAHWQALIDLIESSYSQDEQGRAASKPNALETEPIAGWRSRRAKLASLGEQAAICSRPREFTAGMRPQSCGPPGVRKRAGDPASPSGDVDFFSQHVLPNTDRKTAAPHPRIDGMPGMATNRKSDLLRHVGHALMLGPAPAATYDLPASSTACGK